MGVIVAFARHFSASRHKEDLRSRPRAAFRNSIARFVIEWGTCEASSNGAWNFGQVGNWMELLDENSIYKALPVATVFSTVEKLDMDETPEG